MKLAHLYLGLAGLMILTAAVWNVSWAQPTGGADGSRVAVCDVVEVFNSYDRARDLTEQLNERRAEIERENRERIDTIEVIQTELEGLREGSPEYERRFEEMQRLSIDRKAWLQYQDQLALREHHRLTREMYEEVTSMVGRVGAERGYDVVLYIERGPVRSENTQELLTEIARRRILYAAERVDLTSVVLAELNRAYGGVR